MGTRRTGHRDSRAWLVVMVTVLNIRIRSLYVCHNAETPTCDSPCSAIDSSSRSEYLCLVLFGWSFIGRQAYKLFKTVTLTPSHTLANVQKGERHEHPHGGCLSSTKEPSQNASFCHSVISSQGPWAGPQPRHHSFLVPLSSSLCY